MDTMKIGDIGANLPNLKQNKGPALKLRIAEKKEGASTRDNISAESESEDGHEIDIFEAVLKDLRGFRHHMMDLLVNKVINLFQHQLPEIF